MCFGWATWSNVGRREGEVKQRTFFYVSLSWASPCDHLLIRSASWEVLTQNMVFLAQTLFNGTTQCAMWVHTEQEQTVEASFQLVNNIFLCKYHKDFQCAMRKTFFCHPLTFMGAFYGNVQQKQSRFYLLGSIFKPSAQWPKELISSKLVAFLWPRMT